MLENIRRLSLMLVLIMVAACTQPMLQDGTPQTFVVRDVTVDVASFTGVTGREIAVPPAQVAADVKAALEASLARPGPQTADLLIQLTSVQLTSRGSAAAFGGNSRMTAVLSVRDAATGDVLIAPTQITGFSEFVRVPGVIGAATSPSPESDYRQTVDGFAESVRNQLYGPVTGTASGA
ncbi:hypothetical protein [uncultured Tateyamaria sp.]|uniref:hypothetical protein n=1 Tax=uncultured Tateyamaria sp. TaxID=455651 RepID=UPI002629442B|nr:hypothetical protein [uncultured Tateyamaria sp.]